MNPNRTSMNDLKRRVAGMLEFISHTQVEMAAEVALVPVKTPSSSNTTASAKAPVTPKDQEPNCQTGNAGSQATSELQKAVGLAMGSGELRIEQFKELGSLEMMEVLTRRLMKWQGEYGKFGER